MTNQAGRRNEEFCIKVKGSIQRGTNIMKQDKQTHKKRKQSYYRGAGLESKQYLSILILILIINIEMHSMRSVLIHCLRHCNCKPHHFELIQGLVKLIVAM